MKLDKRAYSVDELIGDEENVLEELEGRLEDASRGYICDDISEIADSNVPIYHSDIWANVQDIQEHIEQAMSEGLTEGVTDLEQIFKCGYYQRYSSLLYENMEDVIYNVGVELLNDGIGDIEHNDLVRIGIEDEGNLEWRLEEALGGIDSGSYSGAVEDAIKELINELEEEIEELEELCECCGEEVSGCLCLNDEEEDEEEDEE